MPPSLADFTHARVCKPICEKLLTLPPKRNSIEHFLHPGSAQSASPITQKTANKKRERSPPSFALCHSKNENARQAGAPKGLSPSKKQ